MAAITSTSPVNPETTQESTGSKKPKLKIVIPEIPAQFIYNRPVSITHKISHKTGECGKCRRIFENPTNYHAHFFCFNPESVRLKAAQEVQNAKCMLDNLARKYPVSRQPCYRPLTAEEAAKLAPAIREMQIAREMAKLLEQDPLPTSPTAEQSYDDFEKEINELTQQARTEAERIVDGKSEQSPALAEPKKEPARCTVL